MLRWLAAALIGWGIALSPEALADEFGFLHTVPAAVVEGQDLIVSGSMLNAGKVTQARVRYRCKGQRDWKWVALESEGGDRYTAVIPGADVCRPALQYWVVIRDFRKSPHLVFASARKPAQVAVKRRGETPAVRPVEPGPGPGPGGETGAGRGTPREQPRPIETPDWNNPFETPEEYELRTGQATMLEGDGMSFILPPFDDEAEGVLPGQDPDLLGEFAVFSAEDATSLAASYYQKTSEAPAIISVVSRQRIEQMGARTLLDVLKAIPGVETSQDISGFHHVAFRGVRNDSEILLLVDGHRWNNFYDGRPYWPIPAELIERVEVIRGPGSALYGTSAFIGVINVVMRETSGLWADVGFGSYLTPHAAVGGGISIGDLNFYGVGNASWTSGPKLAIEEDGATSVVLERDERDSITNAWGFKSALALKGDYTFGALAGGKLYGRGQAVYEQRGPYVGWFDTAGPDSKLSWLIVSGDIGYRQPVLDNGSFDVRLYGDQHNVERLFQLTPYNYQYPVTVDGNTELQTFPRGLLSRTAYVANTVGVETQLQIPIFDVNRLVFGSQVEYLFLPGNGFLLEMNRTAAGVALNELAQPSADALSLDQNGKGRLAAAIYIQDEWQIIKPLFLTVGLRLTKFSDVEFEPLTHITPRAGVVWEIIEDLNLKLLYATAFRAPTFEEKYDQTPALFADFSAGQLLGNKALVPEFIQTGESGLSYETAFSGFRYTLSLNAFYTQIRNSIDRIDWTGTREQLNNYGGRDIVGAEFDARVEFTSGSYLYSTFGWFRAWQRVQDPDDPDVLIEETSLLTDVPQYRLNIGANVEIGELGDLHILTMVGGERRNNIRSTLESIRTFTIKPYALIGVNFRSRPLWDMVGFQLTLRNVLNYPYLDDVPRPDRVIGLLPRERIAGYASIYFKL